jgi:hypothetical protein
VVETDAHRAEVEAIATPILEHIWQIDGPPRVAALVALGTAVDMAEVDRLGPPCTRTTWPRSSTPAVPPAGPRAAC